MPILIFLLVYTKTLHNVEGELWLASQTLNILCYLPTINSGKKGVSVFLRDKYLVASKYFPVSDWLKSPV